MKKLMILSMALLALTLTGCRNDDETPDNPEKPEVTDPENPGGDDPENPGGEDPDNPEEPETPEPTTHVISFESLVDFNGNEPAFTAEGDYLNIVWGKPYAVDAVYDWGDGDTEDYKMYHGLLFADAEGIARFGSYYDNGEQWGYGMEFDVWNGFAASRNYDNTAASADMANQFSVWAARGAEGTDTFLVGYSPDLNWFDPVGDGTPYMIPTVEFSQQCEVQSFWVANSTYTYPYKSYTAENPTLVMTVTAYLEGEEVGSQDVELIGVSERLSDWTKVECRFGTVDKLVFTVRSAEDDYFPTYFCLDEITVVY